MAVTFITYYKLSFYKCCNISWTWDIPKRLQKPAGKWVVRLR